MAEEKKNPTQYKTRVVNYINNFIKKNKQPINIEIENLGTFKIISGAIKVDSRIKSSAGISADPKADIILYANKNNLLDAKNIFISHKKTGGPEVFQQYGGITEKAGDVINMHEEVQDFLKNTTKFIDGKKGLTKPLMRKVKDKNLICKSIFGPEYKPNSKSFGLQNVNLIGQGMPKLTPVPKKPNTFKLEFDHMSVSGDLSKFSQGYTPVFGATFRNKRGFKYNNIQYTGVRVGIYPKALVQGRSNLTEI